MIEVCYHRQFNRVSIAGHAGSGPKGHDLVCAGVSTLALTLAVNVAHMEDQGAVVGVIIDLSEGKAEICCMPMPKYRASVEQIYQAICAGFELLAAKYPENISYAVRG